MSRPIFFPAMAANLSASKTSMPSRTGGNFSAGGVIVTGPGRLIAGGGNLMAALVGLLITALTATYAIMRVVVKSIVFELTHNGGSSLKDQVTRIERRLDDLLTELATRK